MRKLIVNADDFGYTRDVNEGIVEAYRAGIVTSTTIMANAEAFHHAVLLAKENPGLDVGVHLVLVGERALSRVGKALPRTLKGLVAAVFMKELDLDSELDAQMRRVLDAGIRPSHVDTHKHTHLLPQVASAVARAAVTYEIRWVRRPLAVPLIGGFSRRILQRQARMADHFLGYDIMGQFGTKELVSVIRDLPEGLTEFMCHPGYLRDELREARTRLKSSRQRELEALTSVAVKKALDESGVKLTRYSALSGES